MYYHASQVEGIKQLEPRVSDHHVPLVYFSTKRENTLVYLSNAIEKYCRETGFVWTQTLLAKMKYRIIQRLISWHFAF